MLIAKPAWLVIVLSLITLVWAAPSAHANADGQYISDLEARGVPVGVTNGVPPALGHAICQDLDAGGYAGSKVFEVANLQLNGQDQFTLMQAEEIVYWAVTDLCPSHSSELKPYWRDGGAPS
jgi:hypothetical protein